jgi:hypothetical protein
MIMNNTTLPVKYSKLSPSEKRIVREKYIKEQGGRCYHCQGKLEADPPSRVTQYPINWWRFPGGREGFLRYPVHLHHDHNTDLTIGAVHAACNAYLFDYLGE